MSEDHLDAVFAALADPTRRRLLERLVTQGSATPTELAAELPISRQAVSKHLSSLDRAGFVARRRHGRESRYHATAAPLHEVMAWLGEVGPAWDRRLATLKEVVEGDQA